MVYIYIHVFFLFTYNYKTVWYIGEAHADVQ